MTIRFEWVPREPPLAPAGVFASGPAVPLLVKRLCRESDEDLRLLKGVYGNDPDGNAFIIVTGPREKLPWTDGLIYLGYDRDTPGLLLPTLRKPSPDSRLVAGALALNAVKTPAVLIEKPACSVSLNDALPVSRSRLKAVHGER